MATVRTKAQALKAAQKLFGEKAVVRDNGPRSYGKEDREQAVRVLKQIRADKPAEGSAEYEKWKMTERMLMSRTMSYRYDVGYIMPFLGAFLIRGHGDTWNEALDNARK